MGKGIAMTKTERTIDELYRDDPERADAVVFGRRAGVSRRGFMEGAGLATFGAAVGGVVPYAGNIPAGLIPAALAQEKPASSPPAAPTAAAEAAKPKGPQPLEFPGKDKGLVVLGDRPLVAETPEHLLDDDTTPTAKFFIRNNGQIPEETKTPDAWTFTVDGEVEKKLELTLGDLKAKFKAQTLRTVLECGGNGRSFFQPQARGNQWTNGGAGCAEWTGVKLSDVLKAAGLKSTAVYTGHYGADPHLSGDATKETLSRGAPIAKAMQDECLIVWNMNGEPLTNIHGGPVRLVIPGWPGSLSAKWLKRIWVRDKEHDGQGMKGTSYRVTIKPMVPGGKADDANFKIMESMPTRSVITSPANGTKLAAGTTEVAIRGAAWGGDVAVQRVDVSADFGATWQPADVAPAKNRFDWRRFTAKVKLPSDGYYELWVRAMDEKGVAQPHIAGNWNPQGYGANPFHRVAILIG
ncbi:MAG: sulfite oxidase [Hyphomicrobiaceae bacterium]|nr:sulfite oxidase [Hyphomicrobiaceae bacterium]